LRSTAATFGPCHCSGRLPLSFVSCSSFVRSSLFTLRSHLISPLVCLLYHSYELQLSPSVETAHLSLASSLSSPSPTLPPMKSSGASHNIHAPPAPVTETPFPPTPTPSDSSSSLYSSHSLLGMILNAPLSGVFYLVWAVVSLCVTLIAIVLWWWFAKE
jgi:hypothetical protein